MESREIVATSNLPLHGPMPEISDNQRQWLGKIFSDEVVTNIEGQSLGQRENFVDALTATYQHAYARGLSQEEREVRARNVRLIMDGNSYNDIAASGDESAQKVRYIAKGIADVIGRVVQHANINRLLDGMAVIDYSALAIKQREDQLPAAKSQVYEPGAEDPTSESARLRRLLNHGVLTRSQEVELAKRIERGDLEAKEELILMNRKLVASIARNYKYMNDRFDFEERFSEGMFGLIRAAEKFDHRKGFKFSTYATWWIKQAITRGYSDKGFTVRLPVHQHEKADKLRVFEHEWETTHPHEPLPPDYVIADMLDIDLENIPAYRRHLQGETSLDKPVGDDGDATLQTIIANEEPSVEDEYEDIERKDELYRALQLLSPREKMVIEMRNGINGYTPKTLEEIGGVFRVTRERIRQIESEAMRRLEKYVTKQQRG